MKIIKNNLNILQLILDETPPLFFKTLPVLSCIEISTGQQAVKIDFFQKKWLKFRGSEI